VTGAAAAPRAEPARSEPMPTIGRIVHLAYMDGRKFPNSQAVCAAIVTAVSSDRYVNVRAIEDNSAMPAWWTSVIRKDLAPEQHTGLVWFWPPRA